MPIGTYLEQLRREREKTRPSPLLFSHETKQILENQGCRFYTLTGKNVLTVLQETNEDLNLKSYFLKATFRTLYNERVDSIGLAEEMDKQIIQAIEDSSLISEVAVPLQSILQKSSTCTFLEQQTLVNLFSQELQKQTGRNDIKAIIGTTSDYVEIYYQNRQKTKDYVVFDEKDIRTSSKLSGSNKTKYWRTFLVQEADCHIQLSFHNSNSKIFFDMVEDHYKNVALYISPLIVPVRPKSTL